MQNFVIHSYVYLPGDLYITSDIRIGPCIADCCSRHGICRVLIFSYFEIAAYGITPKGTYIFH